MQCPLWLLYNFCITKLFQLTLCLELVELPAVLFESHLMAELVFLLLLFLNTFTKSAQTDFLGNIIILNVQISCNFLCCLF